MACALKLGCESVSMKQLYFSPQFQDPKLKEYINLSSQFMGKSLVVSDQKKPSFCNPQSVANFCVQAHASFCVSKALTWWEKTQKTNMVEIHSTQQLVDALKNACDSLVIVDFYSPGCGGCKSLHPKICQLAESNPDAIFLKVNYVELKPMCQALHIHVLPFFRFYRGVEGRICSFSCTISTIKKFKDALAKHNSERFSLGPAKGLNESELLKLASIGELSRNSPCPSTIREGKFEELVLESMGISNQFSLIGNKFEAKEDNNPMLIS